MRIKGYHIDTSGIYTSDDEFTNRPSFLSFLTKPEPNTIRVFTKLDDCVAGLSRLIKLSQKQAEYLLVTSQSRTSKLTYELGKCLDTPFLIQYFPKKFFKIGEGNNYSTLSNTSGFSDASQYSLKLRKLDCSVTGFVRAKQAKEVGEEAYRNYLSLGFNPTDLVSPVSIFRRGIVEQLDLPTVKDVPQQALLIAYDCAKGGWFESYATGHFSHVYDYDLNGAYPYIISKFLDLRQGKWVCSKKLSHVSDATYGYLSVIAKVHPTTFSPLIYLAEEFGLDRNFTPWGSFATNITLGMARYLLANKLADIEILEGWFFYASPDAQLCALAPYAKKLYEEKQRAIGMKRDILKTMLEGGLYGTFLQMYGAMPSKHFFPPLAAEVQTDTQIAVHKFCIDNNIEPLAVMVDGVTAERPAATALSDKLGGWKLSGEGKAIVISPGTMAIQGKKNGGAEFGLDYDWMMQYAKEYPDADRFEMSNSAIVSLPMAHARNNMMSVGTVYDEKRNIYVSADIKRQHKDSPKTLQELITNQYPSEPFEARHLQMLGELSSNLSNLRKKGGE